MKKILAIILAAMMLVTLVACSDDPEIPGPDTNNGGTPGNTGDTSSDTSDKGDNQVDDWVYEPDLEAKHAGAVGIGVEEGSAYFDNLKVMDKASKKELFYDEIEGEAPAMTYGVGAAENWTVAIDPTDDDEEEPNHALSYIGEKSMAYFGDAKWNYYQFSLKVLPADESTVINIYFLVTDAENYYVLSLNENGNEADVYQVVGGEKTSVAAKVFAPVTAGEWSSVGVTVERETVEIYIAGAHRFSIFNPEFTYSASLSPRATVDAPFCASWENADALNDGQWSDTTFLQTSSGTAYGSWGQSKTTETITFTWDEEVTVDAIGMFFWRDTSDRATWLENGGINLPASYSVQYWNGSEYVDVENFDGGDTAEDVMNVSFFKEVTTTSLQFTLNKFTADEDAQYKFSEHETYDGDANAEDAPQDPTSRGLGLFEIEVYPAGTVEHE